MGETQHETRIVFTAALALNTPEERARYLDKACRGKPELRQRVEALLCAHEQAHDFLEAHGPEQGGVGEGPGTVISHYKLLEEIGEGGFGVVFLAEQLEPIRRRVALKIIKAGMDTRAVIARFEAERQALALMDHPNIAKVLDAGTTETGRPYFVMELVKGLSITAYADQYNLPTEERLQLFMQVCHGVQHAHQKGIIHRDLKPTNILVTVIDGAAVPKIIDFGVAKALGQKLTEKTLFTALDQIIGTPANMSPEQAELSGVDIDTRSDIYALGVLLYELLTGVTPFDQETLRQAALDEVRRIIRESEPPKPSTRLRTLGQKATEIAQHRQVDAGTLTRLVHGDLDWIVMKALEKDRRRRYETAREFAEDIRRHLDHQPVLASPPGAAYQARKFVRRHRVGVAMTTMLVLLSIAGTFVSTWQAVRAKRAEKAARTQAAKANAVSDFLLRLIQSADPSALKSPDYTVRQMLDDFSADVFDQLKEQPEVEATVRLAIGNVYRQLGVGDKAVPHLERALTLFRSLHGSDSRQVVQTLLDCAWPLSSYHTQELTMEMRWEKAKPLLREAQEIARAHGEAYRENLILALGLEGWYMNLLGRYAEAEAALNEALAVAARPPKLEPTFLPSIMHDLAGVRNLQGRFRDAEVLAREALEMHYRLHASNDLNSAWGLQILGDALLGEGKLLEARTNLEDALEIFSHYFSLEHRNVAGCRAKLVSTLQRLQDWPVAEKLIRETLERQRERLGVQHPDVATSLQNLACVLEAQHRLAEAETLIRKILAQQRAAPGDDSPAVAETLCLLADNLQSQGRPAEAEPFFREALALHLRLLEGGASSLEGLFASLASQGRTDEARAVVQETAEACHALLRERKTPEVFEFCGNLVGALMKATERAAAESLARAVLAAQTEVLGSEHQDVARAHTELAYPLRMQGKLLEAEQHLRQAVALFDKLGAGSQADWALEQLLEVLQRLGKHDPEMERRGLQGKLRRADRKQPWVAYNLRIETPGQYQLFLRWDGHDFASDSLYAQIVELKDGVEGAAVDIYYFAPAMPDADFATSPWQGTGEPVDRASPDVPAVWSILQPGNYTLKLLGFEDGAAVDAFVLQLSSLPPPQGEGPPESELAADKAFLEQKGRVVGEAEHFTTREGDSGRFDWLIVPRQNPGHVSHLHYRGSGYIQYLPDVSPDKPLALLANRTTARVHEARFADAAEAEQIYREATVASRKISGSDDADSAYSLHELARALLAQGRLAEAEAVARDALALGRRLLGNEHLNVAHSLHCVAQVREAQGKLAEAEIALREALAIRRKLLGNESMDVSRSLHRLAWVLNRNGKRAEAEALSREELALRRRLLGNEDAWVAWTLDDLASFLRDQGKLTEAEAKSRESLAIRRKALGDEHRDVARSLLCLAGILESEGKLAEAEPVYCELVQIRRKQPDQLALAGALAQFTHLLLNQQKCTQAEPVARECLALRETLIPDNWLAFNARSLLGGSLLGQKKYVEAELLLLSGYEGMKQREASIPRLGKPRLPETLQRLVQLYEATDRLAQAAEWKQKLAGLLRAESETNSAATSP